MTPLTDDEIKILRATLARLIPADDFPGAVAADVDRYIERQLLGDLASQAPAFASGIRTIDSEAHKSHGLSFVQLSPADQDTLLARIEIGSVNTAWSQSPQVFFEQLTNLAAEGYYADPGNGGNKDGVSWGMIGYSPRQPEKITAP